jgi:DNA-binding NtrC family response regulator
MIELSEQILNMPLKEARKVFERKYLLNAFNKHKEIPLMAEHSGLNKEYMYVKLHNLGMLVNEETGE